MTIEERPTPLLDRFKHWISNGGKFQIVLSILILGIVALILLEVTDGGPAPALVVTDLEVVEPVAMGRAIQYARRYCNEDGAPLTATVQRRFLQADGEGGERELTSIETGSIELAPGQCQVAKLSFNLPGTITPGVWRLRLLITTTTPTLRLQSATSDDFEIIDTEAD